MKRTRKLSAFLILASLMATIFQILPATAAGGNCTQSGLLSFQGSQRLICKKNASKLSWVPDLEFKVTSPLTDYATVGVSAIQQIKSVTNRNRKLFRIHWDPTTTPSKKDFYQKQINVMEHIYGPLVPSGKIIDIYILGSDKKWGSSKLREFSKGNASFIREYGNKYVVSTKCQLSSQGQMIPDNPKYGDPYTEQRGRGGGINQSSAYGFVTLSNCDNYIEEDILPHETFHAVQWLNAWNNTTRWPGMGKTFGMHAASWVTEGQAQYMGKLLSQEFQFKSFATEKTLQFYSNTSKRWRGEYAYLNGYETNDSYDAGAVMFEYMVARFGLKDVLKLHAQSNLQNNGMLIIQNEKRYKPFEKAFKGTLGISHLEFLKEVRPYLEWSLEQGAIAQNELRGSGS